MGSHGYREQNLKGAGESPPVDSSEVDSAMTLQALGGGGNQLISDLLQRGRDALMGDSELPEASESNDPYWQLGIPGQQSSAKTDNLDAASPWLDRETSYRWGADERGWKRGEFDCTSFTSESMRAAGYDPDQEVQHTIPLGPEDENKRAEATASREDGETVTEDLPEPVEIEGTVYDFTIMNHTALPELAQAAWTGGDSSVERILQKHGVRGRGLAARIDKLPEGTDKAEAQKHRATAKKATAAKLKELVLAGDPRTRGAINAMELAEIGREVAIADLKPGDIIQTWQLYRNGGLQGHSTQVATVKVRALVLEGDAFVWKVVVMDADTEPASIASVEEVLEVELLGAHLAGKNSEGEDESGGVYVKPTDFSRYKKVYAGRMSGSDWAHWTGTEESGVEMPVEQEQGWAEWLQDIVQG